MKKYYVFVRTPKNFTAESVIFDVSCGVGVREQNALMWLKEYAADFDAYLQVRSDVADHVIESLCERAFKGKRFATRYAKRVRISICELVTRLKNKSLGELEKPVNVGRNWLHMMSRFDAKFPVLFPSRAKAKSAQSVKRKNLSPRNEPTLEEAIIGLVLIPILFMLAGAIEHYESILLF